MQLTAKKCTKKRDARAKLLFCLAKLIGSFSNGNGDGSENVKKVIGLLSKTTTLHVHLVFFLYISLTPMQGGVYMRKLAPARVSYRHDFLISYRVYMMTGSFHISLFEGTLYVDKMHV